MDETMDVTTEVSEDLKAFLAVFSGAMSRAELMDNLGLINAEHFRLRYLKKVWRTG